MRAKLIRFVPKLPDVSTVRGDDSTPAELAPAGATHQLQGGEPT
jgi:hypothetical protein